MASSGGAASGPIKIAIVDAQSGQLSSLGVDETQGVKLAVDAANAAGGINGRQIQLQVFDDKGDPTTSTNLASAVASGGFVFQFGPAESTDALAMAPVLQKAQIAMITSGQADAIANLHDPFMFLNTPTSSAFDTTLAKYVVTTKGWNKVALITNSDSYGKSEHDAFTKALTDLGITPVADQVVAPDQKDFSSALSAIGQASPQVLFTGMEEVESGLVVNQTKSLGMSVQIVGGAPMFNKPFLQTAGANANGCIGTSPYLGNDTNAASKAFAAAIAAAYPGTVSDLHQAKAYDGAQIVLLALKQTNGEGGKALADAIRATPYAGLVGTFAFDADGVGVHATQMGIVQNGAVAPLQ
ncbi:MAG TPA: ABC transporter substrate-binding protein [Candidatus Limnocylindria bacterium]